jgi:3-dehydroquinate synthase
MHVINMKSKVRDYTVAFPERVDFIRDLTAKSDSIFVVDSDVWHHHKDGCLKSLSESSVVVFPVSEERKNLKSVEELYDRFMDSAAKKNMNLVSIGGGILQDVTGFAATTLYRGINWTFLPTTLLAQADSCIGSKTSLNYKRFKNLVGTFYPPSEVFIYAPFLATLKEVDFFSGLGEVVKLHIMGGKETTAKLIELLPRIRKREPDALMTCVRNSLMIKQNYMEGDEFDLGRRNLLNFGHCFGHALETVSDYAIPHGQAVVIGMVFANIAAGSRGFLSSEQAGFLCRELLLNTIVEKGKLSDYDYENLRCHEER